MLTNLRVRNFKLFEDVSIELGDRVVFVGPNNSGKTSALQALALWSHGARRWVEKRGGGNVPKERSGVTINRRDLIALPVPSANLLWRGLHVREGYRDDGKQKTRNLLIEIEVEGVRGGEAWSASLEFDYANEESFYCRSRLGPDGQRLEVPAAAAETRIAYLPPMSGILSVEPRLDEGAIGVRVGEGRTAEVLRNLCWQVRERSEEAWNGIVDRIGQLFGVTLEAPDYVKERGEIVMSYRDRDGTRLDLSASGRGQQQTLLLLAYMAANPGSVLLLDEPDAHLEILRQRQIYQELAETAERTGSQIIAASHSEVILDEAADRDTVVAFVGTPHRIDDRSGKSQVLKALKSIGFDQYLLAETAGFVLYLEGSTDLDILRAFAETLDHPARSVFERPFVHYVANQPRRAQEHFHGLREAKQDLVGLAIYDRLEQTFPSDPHLHQRMWSRREIENYLCQEATLLAWVDAFSRREAVDLFASPWREAMERSIADQMPPIARRDPSSPWWTNTKMSDDFLDPVFRQFFETLKLPNLMRKTDYHTLARFVARDDIAGEVRETLDAIVEVAGRATPRGVVE